MMCCSKCRGNIQDDDVGTIGRFVLKRPVCPECATLGFEIEVLGEMIPAVVQRHDETLFQVGKRCDKSNLWKSGKVVDWMTWQDAYCQNVLLGLVFPCNTDVPVPVIPRVF